MTYYDVLNQATFTCTVETLLTSCTGTPLCLDIVQDEMSGQQVLGYSPNCERRFAWKNILYKTITESEYATAETGSVDEETQKWVIGTEGGCLRMEREKFPFAGDRVVLDPDCSKADGSEWFALLGNFSTGPNDIRGTPEELFSFVDSNGNNSRRYAIFPNTTYPYTDPTTGDNCSCIDTEDKLGSVMLTQRHMSYYLDEANFPDASPDHDYYAYRDACDGHVFRCRYYPPSPPPPSDRFVQPPAPPFFAAQTTAAVEGFTIFPAVAIGLLCCFGAMYRRRAFGRAKIVEAGPGFRTRDPRVHTREYRDRAQQGPRSFWGQNARESSSRVQTDSRYEWGKEGNSATYTFASIVAAQSRNNANGAAYRPVNLRV